MQTEAAVACQYILVVQQWRSIIAKDRLRCKCCVLTCQGHQLGEDGRRVSLLLLVMGVQQLLQDLTHAANVVKLYTSECGSSLDCGFHFATSQSVLHYADCSDSTKHSSLFSPSKLGCYGYLCILLQSSSFLIN